MKLKLLGDKRIVKKDTCSCGCYFTWVENEKGELLKTNSGIITYGKAHSCVNCGRSLVFE